MSLPENAPSANDDGSWQSLGATLRRLLPEAVLAAAPLAPPPPQCGRCEDGGYYVIPVPVGHPEFGRLHRCACVAGQRQLHARAARSTRLSGLGAYVDKTFAAFDGDVPGVQRVLAIAEAYAETLEGWLVLWGAYGCGKTHLAAAVANAALARGRGTIFAAVPDLLDHLKATFAPSSSETYDERFELLRTVDLLVLDDLGTESATAWAREKLYQLINHRYVQRLPLVVTSNVSLDLLDGRIRSRLQDRALGS
ncbi:MAG: ATP-binding protein, partial [Chloroflexales bacterium]|nr:ATP-binding protein [Chloroflexales bacterium]